MNTYAQMISQIEDLKKQAEKIRKEEFSSVVKSIRKQILDYGITARDLGLSVMPRVEVGKKSRKASGKTVQGINVKRSREGRKVAPKYRDDEGNTWTGRGKQPKWVVAALESGRSLDSLRIS